MMASQYTVGLGETGRVASKTTRLQPPGGLSNFADEVRTPDAPMSVSQAKNSSRVLKPPGGGMSSVFAGDSSPEPEEQPSTPVRPYRMASNFELSDEQPDNVITPPRKNSKPTVNPVTGEIMVYPGSIGSSNASSIHSSPISSPNNGKMSLETSPMSTPPIKSKRVPPGGYSSPLW